MATSPENESDRALSLALARQGRSVEGDFLRVWSRTALTFTDIALH